jgi:DNA-binding NarL/FixJ family response regulator
LVLEKRLMAIRVLHVEEHDHCAVSMRAAILGPGVADFEVVHHATLAAAETSLESTGYDVVLLDLTPPDCPGLPAYERMRAAVPDTPIVVMASPGEEEVAQATVEAGAVEFLIRGPAALQALSGVMLAATDRE